MITLKFQKDPEASTWAYTSSFISFYSHIVIEGESLKFGRNKLSKQPCDDIVKLSDFIGKFKDFTLIAHVDCSNSINAKKLIEIADEVYVEDKLVKSTDIEETKMSKNMDMELRIPEDQMQRLEAIATNIQKSVGPKTWKQKILGLAFSRISILLMVGAYFWMGSEPPKVVNYDRANGVISVEDNGVIQNLIWSDNKLLQNGKVLKGDFSKKIERSLLLGLDIVGLEDLSWF